jgi:hypothetical protein
MFGKVHGPYTDEKGIKRVVVVLKNPNGSVLSKTTISYPKYLKECAEGLHRYEELPPVVKQNKASAIKIRRDRLQRVCLCCKINFSSFVSNFCSKNCREKYKRQRNKKKQKIHYHRQIVVPIDGLDKEDDKYYIVVDLDRNKRDHRFVKQKDCIKIIDEDNNNVAIFRLHYKLEDSVRIKTVPGYKKYFLITESGILVSRRTNKILSQTLNHNGYCTHSSKLGGRNGKEIGLRIHRCVAEAFISNPEDRPEVNHIDGVKANNQYTNLEWVTALENVRHARANGLCRVLRGCDSTSTDFVPEDIIKIRLLAKEKTRAEIGRLFNRDSATITRIVNRQTFSDIE